MAEYLLHSMSEFSEIFQEILSHVSPRRLVEIGSEYGGSTKILLDYAKTKSAFLEVIDPSPYADLSKVFSGFDDFYIHHRARSLDVLPEIVADIYFIDGDHNYWTVKNELGLIYKPGQSPWVILHDLAYPCGRRDQYYCPSDIPSEGLHPYTYEMALDEHNELSAAGFSGMGHFAFAVQKGGPRNGVLTAVEDFIRDREDLHFSMINPIFGMGVIAPRADAARVDEILKPYKNKLIDRMEDNRISLYIELIRTQSALENLRKSFWVRVLRKIRLI